MQAKTSLVQTIDVQYTSDNRGLHEVAYFDEGMTTEEIANEVDCSEDAVYRHMKEQFQPLVRRSSTAIVSIKVGEELESSEATQKVERG